MSITFLIKFLYFIEKICEKWYFIIDVGAYPVICRGEPFFRRCCEGAGKMVRGLLALVAAISGKGSLYLENIEYIKQTFVKRCGYIRGFLKC